MKTVIKLLSTLSALLLIANTGYAAKVCSREGPITECGAGKIDQLDVAGKATLHDTVVLGDTHIAGVLVATGAELNTLNLAGKATLNTTTLLGASKFSGLLVSCGSTFNDKITISSDKIHFDHSQTKDIDVNEGGDAQVVYVGNKSVIKGNVHFSSGNGVVILDASSKINGKIVGGYLSTKEFDSNC